MVDRKALRLSATLMFISLFIFGMAFALHPHRELANNHLAVFAEYAQSADWAAVHLAGFVATALLFGGLLVLFFALNLSEGTPRWLGVFGAISAGLAIALYGVQMAVDGVALKQAVGAWASAPAAEKAARFAAAEAIRWLEWGTASYQNYMSGLAMLLFGIVIAWTGRVPKAIGYILGLAGLCSFAAGWVLGTVGFAPNPVLLASQVVVPVAVVWLFIVAWWRRGSLQAIQPTSA